MAERKVGRRKMRPEDKRVNVTLSVSPVAREVMNQLSERGYYMSREFDDFIMKWGKREKIIDSKGRLIIPQEDEEEA